MGKKIACICGKKGRVQHKRFEFLRDNYMPYLDVFSDEDKIRSDDYDVVYYSHYSLFRNYPFRGTCIASVTSHKYDKRDIRKMGFDAISVNNKFLMEELKKFNPVLTENGVDTKFWTDSENKKEYGMIIGWVGNKDRKAKRYWLIDKMAFVPRGNIDDIATSKHDDYRDILDPEKMRDRYRKMDFLLVTSESEGTPNPALEAMSCGTKVASTPVGNMPDIESVWIYDLYSIIHFAPCDTTHTRADTRQEMVDKWDWSIKYKPWDNFFRRYL